MRNIDRYPEGIKGMERPAKRCLDKKTKIAIVITVIIQMWALMDTSYPDDDDDLFDVPDFIRAQFKDVFPDIPALSVAQVGDRADQDDTESEEQPPKRKQAQEKVTKPSSEKRQLKAQKNMYEEKIRVMEEQHAEVLVKMQARHNKKMDRLKMMQRDVLTQAIEGHDRLSDDLTSIMDEQRLLMEQSLDILYKLSE